MIIVAIEGVLAEGPLPNVASTATGRLLTAAWPEANWHLLTSMRDQKLTEDWLLREGYSRWSTLKTMEHHPDEDYSTWKVEIVQGILAAGYRPSLYIDTDTQAVSGISSIGVPSFLMVPPGQFPRPGNDYTAWDELTGIIEQRSLAIARARMTA